MVRLIIVIFIISCFYGCDNKLNTGSGVKDNYEKLAIQFGKKGKELIFNFKKIEDASSERIFKEIKTKSLLKFGGIVSELFSYPSRIIVDSKGNIYVLDNLDCSVSKFDKAGNFVTKYGKKGRGPGEFENAFAFDVYKSSQVDIASPNDNIFTVFSSEDGLSEYKCSLMSN